MPLIKSSIKDVRRIKRRTARNSAEKNKIRTILKSVHSAKTAEEAQAKLKLAMSTLHKAWSHGIIKKNNASRHIARLSSLVFKKFQKS